MDLVKFKRFKTNINNRIGTEAGHLNQPKDVACLFAGPLQLVQSANDTVLVYVQTFSSQVIFTHQHFMMKIKV